MLLAFLNTRQGAVLLLDEPDAHLHVILQDARLEHASPAQHQGHRVVPLVAGARRTWEYCTGGLTMAPEPIADFIITPHAMFQMARRGLTRDIVARVLAEPGQRHEIRTGRVVVQSQLMLGTPAREYLVRVFVDVDRRPPAVVTAYRTSRVEKYWRRAQ